MLFSGSNLYLSIHADLFLHDPFKVTPQIF